MKPKSPDKVSDGFVAHQPSDTSCVIDPYGLISKDGPFCKEHMYIAGWLGNFASGLNEIVYLPLFAHQCRKGKWSFAVKAVAPVLT